MSLIRKSVVSGAFVLGSSLLLDVLSNEMIATKNKLEVRGSRIEKGCDWNACVSSEIPVNFTTASSRF